MSSLALTLASARRFGERRPEAWVGLLSAAAWLAMLPHMFGQTVCHQLSFWADWRSWMLMVVAMMVPLLLPALRFTADRSFRYRQHRAMLLHLVGYLIPWALCGLIVCLLMGRTWGHAAWLPAACFALASVWAATPVYARLMDASHRIVSLHPSGWRANRDCVYFGLVQGLPCTGSCALMMAGCAVSGHGLVAMVGGALLAATERRSFRPRRWLVPAGSAALALWYGIVWLGK